MKYIYQILILGLSLPACVLHAMDYTSEQFVIDLQFKDSDSEEEQEPLIPKSLLQLPQEKPSIPPRPLIHPLFNKTTTPMQRHAHFEEENGYIPLTAIKPHADRSQQSDAETAHIVNAITERIKKEALLKLTYDMTTMQDLNMHAYTMTTLHLTLRRSLIPNFISKSPHLMNGTPGIIQQVEANTPYRFPNNIVVRIPMHNACSLSQLAFFTSGRVLTQRQIIIDHFTYGLDLKHKKEIEQKIPPTNHFIKTAINDYLDRVEEPPAIQRKRAYKQAIKNLFESDPSL